MVCSSLPPQAASRIAGTSASVLLYFMAFLSSELQGDGAADDVDVAVCCHIGFIAVKVDQREIALLQLLVLIAQVQPHRVSQQAGPVIGGTDAKANNDFVGVQVVEFGITRRFQR